MPRPVRPISPPRLLPIRALDPPYDDERDPLAPPPDPSVDGTLALAFEPVAPPEPAAVSNIGTRMPENPPPPDARRLRFLAQAIAEVLAGFRPVETLTSRLTERVFAELSRAGKMIDTPRPPLVGRPHICRPRHDALEVCVLVNCGGRACALAIRLERHGIQWLCTDFETA